MKKFNQATPFFSNKLERLYEELKLNLFKSSNPFTKRIIIAPSSSLHSWIKLAIASDVGISAGISTCFLNQGVLHITDLLFNKPEKSFIPDKIELILRLESEIRKALEETEQVWDPLKGYLHEKEQRLMPLVNCLVQLFEKYGIYGGQEVSQWQDDPFNWQQMLWKRIFTDWNYPARFLNELETKNEYSRDLTIHLFSFSHISPLHFQFFNHVGKLVPLYYYHLSPCRKFWSDIQSDRENQKLNRILKEKKVPEAIRVELEGYLLDRSPLLANLGKVGRKQALLFEESEMEPIECYVMPEGNTQLEKVQRSLLNLEQVEDICEDDSIQVHVAPTRYREIEILYNNLLHLFHEGSAAPGEVIVMAPDITIYEPYIRAFFQGNGGHQIADMPIRDRNLHVNGLMKLIDLEKNRWSAPVLLDLFNHPLFLNKIGWSYEDVLQIREWIQLTGIRWGIDAKHRDQLLEKSGCELSLSDPKATWKQGIDYLLEELAMSQRERPRIDYSQSELLGELTVVIESLQDDLSAFTDGSKRNLKEWIVFLKEVNETYFLGEEEQRKEFYAQLEILNRASSCFSNNLYSFHTFICILDEIIGQESFTINLNHLQQVRFCSLVPMRTIPAKIICMIGMDIDAFPRKEITHSLDLIREKTSPSRMEFDRYLFLEVILSARKKLIISYPGSDPTDQTDKPPSTVVFEILPYISQNQVIHHPFLSYDPSYYDDSNKMLRNYSEREFKMAKALDEKKSPGIFFIHLPKKPKLTSDEYVIDLSELQKAARSPLRHFYHHALNLNFYDEAHVKEEEDFLISPIQFSKIGKMALSNPLESVLQLAKKEEGYPLGIFGEIAQSQIQRKISSVNQGVSFQLLVHEKQCRQIETNLWHLPALRIACMNANFVITGRIDGITEDCLQVFERGNFSGAIKSWPQFLVYSALERPFGRNAILFAKDQKFKEPFFENAENHLKTFLEYYFESMETPFPFHPDWVSYLLKDDPQMLEKAVQKTLEDAFDPAVQWALQGKIVCGPMLIENWKEKAEYLYGEMDNAWFRRSK